MATKIQDSNNNPSPEKNWWNRPLFGQHSLIEIINNLLGQKFFKPEISEASLAIYKHSIHELKNIAAVAHTIDKEKFSSREFMTFLKINSLVEKDQGEYQGLKSSIELLRVALETKDCFLKIEATESRYHAYAQTEFYQFVFELLGRNVDKDKFKESVQKKSTKIIPKMKTEEGKAAIQSYLNQLDILSKDQIGLKLLFLFKQYDLSNFTLLKKVAEIADTFYEKENLEDLKEFLVIVQVKSETFLKLGEIIQVPTAKNIPNTYAYILQYIALRNRHQNAFGQFQQLVGILKDWVKFYDPLLTIRTQYPPIEYKQPPIFQEEIPGLNLYNKYQQHIESK